jgi:inner membrane protein
MPSPLGHALAGLTVHVISANDGTALASRRRAGVAVAAGVVPDLDLLLRLVDGRNHHQAESHSLGCALLAAGLAFVVARWRRWAEPPSLAVVAGFAWASHLVLDYLGRDTHPPIGIMAFWPVSQSYFKFPWPIFLDIGRTLEWKTVVNNVVAITWETVLLAPLLYFIWRRRSRALSDRMGSHA